MASALQRDLPQRTLLPVPAAPSFRHRVAGLPHIAGGLFRAAAGMRWVQDCAARTRASSLTTRLGETQYVQPSVFAGRPRRAHPRVLPRAAVGGLAASGRRAVAYPDQAWFTEPDGGSTLWHADPHYWPLSNGNTSAAWIPLQALPVETRPLTFGQSSHRLRQNRRLAIRDASERRLHGL